MLDNSTSSRNGHSKPTRNSDHRHAQAVGRQRAQAQPTPQRNAQCIANIIRKRISEHQPIEDLTQYGLDEATWSELIALLSPEELAAVNAASGQSDLADDDDDEPIPFELTPPQPVAPAPTPKPELPGWRSAFPAHTHSLNWVDSDGISHSCRSLRTSERILENIATLSSN